MNTTYLNIRSFVRTLLILLSATLLSVVLMGCASTGSQTGPGTPDETQLRHYEMLKTAIEAKSKDGALAALSLLNDDISRWRVNWAVIAATMYDQNYITDAVLSEDWKLVNTRFQSLKAKYGHP